MCFGWYEVGRTTHEGGRTEAGLCVGPDSKGWWTSEGATTLRGFTGGRLWSGEMRFRDARGRRVLKSIVDKPWSPACMSYSATYGFGLLLGNAAWSLSNGLREMRRDEGRRCMSCSAMSCLRDVVVARWSEAAGWLIVATLRETLCLRNAIYRTRL